MKICNPAPDIFAFYDGRIPGQTFMPESNWVDDGALSVGIASYAIVNGTSALVYDTHVSLDHARIVRKTLEEHGIRHFTVLLSHWHLDHVAGTEIFADSEIIANAKTARHLASRKAAIESGESSGPPAILPLILPNRTFAGEMAFMLGNRELRFIEANIHSDDQSLVWMKDERILLAGDALEDTVTYVVEPENFRVHVQDLARIRALEPTHILPNHGDPDVIASGGYGPGLIDATRDYVQFLLRAARDEALAATPLQDILALHLKSGAVTWFEPYARVHEENLALARKAVA